MSHRIADEELLRQTATRPASFGLFYERHERLILSYMVRRTDDAELAADLTAETFARALESAHRFKNRPEPAVAWLLGIAQNVLAMSRRRGRVEARARQRLGIEPATLDDDALQQITDTGGNIEVLLAKLPPDQRAAVLARVVDELDYPAIAENLRCSEAVARKRVSRGLASLRRNLEART